jgi:hypothetical protein
MNAESSRSHTVFTYVLESRHERTSGGLSSLRTSRINLVDLAGSERQKLTGVAREQLKEVGNINHSLSQLGNLIKILAEVSQTGKQRYIPYCDFRLTFLLQESLGGSCKDHPQSSMDSLHRHQVALFIHLHLSRSILFFKAGIPDSLGQEFSTESDSYSESSEAFSRSCLITLCHF